jgi:hypothetical protein
MCTKPLCAPRASSAMAAPTAAIVAVDQPAPSAQPFGNAVAFASRTPCTSSLSHS